MINFDSPDFYDDKALREWAARFNSPEGFWEDGTPRIALPGIPFSYPELCRALIRSDNIKSALEDK